MDKEVIRILNECKIINIKEKEPFPELENDCTPIIIVGLTNSSWGNSYYYDCKEFYNIQYTNHGKMTYGGNTSLDKNGNSRSFWTMNYVYNDIFCKDYAYIVKNYEDGKKLAEFLNSINGFLDELHIRGFILEKIKEQKKIQSEIDYYNDILKFVLNNSL